MNIAVIAANGRSGKAFVTAALAAGHTVRAGVRGTHDLPAHPHISIVPCDATDETDVRTLVAQQDAVISFIGHVKCSAANVQTEAMQVLVKVLTAERGTIRLVSLTGTGVRMPGDKISLVDRILNTAIAFIDPKRIEDGMNHVRVLQQSQLAWTVLRVLKLQNIAARGFSLRSFGPVQWVSSRDDVAQAALQVLEDNSFIHDAPILSRPQG